MRNKLKLPIFEGKALVKIPKNFPKVDILRGDLGKKVLEEYLMRIWINN